jgi:HlyD family secretion protein
MAGDIDRAQIQQKQAASDVESLRQLQQKGAASAAEVAAAEQRLLTANSTLQSLQQRSTQRYSSGDRDRAQAQIADAQAALDSARAGYDQTNIRTPISGTVYSLPVSEYDFVGAGEDLMDVADLNRIQVRAYFDEPEIGALSPGQAVKIVWDAKPDRIWHGHIELAPTTVIAYGTRSVGECIITVDDARGDLLPNTNVNVTVTPGPPHRRRQHLRLSSHRRQARKHARSIRCGQPHPRHQCRPLRRLGRDHRRPHRKGHRRSQRH